MEMDMGPALSRPNGTQIFLLRLKGAQPLRVKKRTPIAAL